MVSTFKYLLNISFEFRIWYYTIINYQVSKHPKKPKNIKSNITVCAILYFRYITSLDILIRNILRSEYLTCGIFKRQRTNDRVTKIMNCK